MSSSSSPRLERLLAFLERETLVLGVVALYAIVVLVALPQMLVQDSWLTLVGGREVARHGLPGHDALTVWTRGADWVDQQWLAQLAFYGLAVLGGLKLALLAHAALVTAALAGAVAAARRRGASAKAVALVAVLCMFLAPWALQLRAQSLAEPLFVALLWLLVADGRKPSRRVFLALPLLALWANVHGTVVMGVGLTLTYSLSLVGRGRRLRGFGLGLGAVGALFASPYGLALGGYYHRLLLNPLLKRFLDEWRPSTPSQKTALFYVLAFATVWLLARHGRRLTGFEQAVLLSSAGSALLAIRSIVWFALAAIVLLPTALDGALSASTPGARRRLPALAALVAVAAAAGLALARPTSAYERGWPEGAARAVGAVAARDPSARVFADDRYADWLLWTDPRLTGRVAYDVRFELFSNAQFTSLFAYRNRVGDGWRRAAAGYELLAFDRTTDRTVERATLAEPGARLLYGDARIAVVERPASRRSLAAVGR